MATPETTSRKRLWAAAVAGAGALAVGVVLLWPSRNRADRVDGVPIATRSAAVSIAAALAAGSEIEAPYRCARMARTQSPRANAPTAATPGDGGAEPAPEPDAERALAVGARTLVVSGDAAAVREASDGALIVGVIADARGADAQTLAGLDGIREKFAAAGVELVVSLGGLARDRAEIESMLDRMSDGVAWAVLALPGDREDVAAHRAAVAAVAARGRAVLDGAQIRLVSIDGVAIGTLPGAPAASRLVAGIQGCVFADEDAQALASALAAQTGVRVLASHAPPRQTAADASDIAGEGIHIGEPAVAAALVAAEAQVALHGLIDEAALGAPRGQRALGRSPVILGVGAADAMPVATPTRAIGANRRARRVRRSNAALIVTLTARRARWQRIAVSR